MTAVTCPPESGALLHLPLLNKEGFVPYPAPTQGPPKESSMETRLFRRESWKLRSEKTHKAIQLSVPWPLHPGRGRQLYPLPVGLQEFLRLHFYSNPYQNIKKTNILGPPTMYEAPYYVPNTQRNSNQQWFLLSEYPRCSGTSYILFPSGLTKFGKNLQGCLWWDAQSSRTPAWWSQDSNADLIPKAMIAPPLCMTCPFQSSHDDLQ